MNWWSVYENPKGLHLQWIGEVRADTVSEAHVAAVEKFYSRVRKPRAFSVVNQADIHICIYDPTS